MKKVGDKVAIVTGGNKGIGFEIVKALCQRFPGIVYLTARDEKRGLQAIEQLEKLQLRPRFHLLDINSIESIQAFKKTIKEEHGGIDVLVNNAAIAYFVSKPEPDPFALQAENTIRTNYFGTLNVCHELFSLLRPHGRVVNASSALGHLTKINGKEPAGEALRKQLSAEDLSEEKLSDLMRQFVNSCQDETHRSKGWPNSAYAVSKVGVSALSRIQQWTFDDTRPNDDIIVNAVHPGYVKSDLTGWHGMFTVAEGAVAPTYCALLPENVKTPRGAFVWRDTKTIDWIRGPVPTPGY